MDREQVKSRFEAILKKYTRTSFDWEGVTEDASILGKLNINSARFVDLIIDVEDEFDIEINDETMNKIITINNGIEIIIQLIEKN